MTFTKTVRISTVAIALAIAASSAHAQEISPSHLKAARAAVDAIESTDVFDNILPAAAQALKRELIQKNPDISTQITQTVDQKTLELASRRADLETEAANAYARALSEEDLNAIAAFYTSPAGKNLLAKGQIVTRETAKAAEIWQNGIARDLAQQVGEALNKEVGAPKTAAGQEPAAPATPAPAEGTAN